MANDDPPSSPVATNDVVAAAQLPPPPSDRPPRLPPPSRRISGLESADNGTYPQDELDVPNAIDLEHIRPTGSRRVSIDPPLPPTPQRHRTPVAPPQGRPAVTASTKRKKPGDEQCVSVGQTRPKQRSNTSKETTTQQPVQGLPPQKKAKKSAPTKKKSTPKPASDPNANRCALIHNEFISFVREKRLVPKKVSEDNLNAHMKEFNRFHDSFYKQCEHRFSYVQKRGSETIESMGMGTRSSLSQIDEEAAVVNTTDLRRLSRYHMEDALGLKEGDRVLLYFRMQGMRKLKWLNKKTRGWDISHVIEANDAQPFKMMGDRYIQLYATVTQAKLNKDIQYGHCTMSDFKRHYVNSGV